MSLSDSQLAAITAAERATSILSVVGTTIIISTFLASPSFRKPINRVVFFASWANILTNVGTLISRTAIVQKEHGGVLCRFQAFIIQWFMPSDALWTFSMAFNVYLTFFHKYDAAKLRHLEWTYMVFCYGLPFIPPFAYFFISSSSKGPVYGSATLWCWVAVDWDILRIAVFYGPVWFVILLTFAIYARVGIDIARKRRTLRSFNKEATTKVPSTINRVYSLIYPDDAIFGLEFVSSFVLPLQGFWNSIIYIAVSWSTVMEFVDRFRARRQSPSSSSAGEMALKQYCGTKGSENGGSQVGRRVSDTESTTYFAKDAEGVQRPQQNQNQQREGESLSPPPPAPIQLTPGPRASRLQDIYSKALRATLKANSYENFAACFPTPARHVPASLESVHRQLNAKLEEGATAEFNEIIKEREVIKGLNELDRLVGEARRRKSQGESESDVPPHMLDAEGLYKAHLTPYLQEAQVALNAKIETAQSQNAVLAEKVLAQRKEIESLLSGLEAVMADLEGSAKTSTEYSKTHNLRQESLQIDEEMKIHTDS
ncbi:hypothetical protein ZTR_04592 [Talaromyces verruculosus]|nr:hypothetical protein ZTR_04592 [Talaromyces verruculosus]